MSRQTQATYPIVTQHEWALPSRYCVTISIQVSRLDDRSVKIDVKCKAYRAPNDHGQNNKMIAEFYLGLEKSLTPG